ncbi:hypothetical protein Tco_1425211, partial [Tanacetum coccineum]
SKDIDMEMDEASLVIDEAPQSKIHAKVKSTCYSIDSDLEVFGSDIRRCAASKDVRLWLLLLFSTAVTDIHEKDKNKANNDKIEHEKGKSVKQKSTKVNPDKVKVKGGAVNEEILNGLTRTHLMGRVSPLRYYMKT